MTEAAFTQLVEALKCGNNEALQQLQSYQAYCQKTVMIKSHHRCSAGDAYDIFIDAILDFRKNVLAGKVKNKAIRAYLAQICWNKWLEKSRREHRIQAAEAKVRQSFYGEGSTTGPEAQQIQKEELEARSLVKAHQSQEIEKAMQLLSEKCRRILLLSIVDEVPMAAIAEMMGFANANVAKTSKSRCYKQLADTVLKKK